MPVEAKDGLRFISIPSDDLDDPFSDQTEWPRLSCPQVNQLALEFGELRIDESLTVNNAISTNQLSVIGSVTTPLTIDNILTVNSAIATNQLSVSGNVTGSLTIENDLTVGNAIATQQLSVSDSVTGSLTIENDLTVGNAIATQQLSVSGVVTGSLTVENDLTVGNAIVTQQLNVIAPEAKLEVKGDDPVLKIWGQRVDDNATIQLRESTDAKWGFDLKYIGKTDNKFYIESYEDGVSKGKHLTIKRDSGNVGIGTSSPIAKLDVTGGALNISNPGNGKVLAFLNTERHWQLRQFGTGAPTALELASVGGGGNKNLLISTTGRVGIGTTSPGQTLDVRGTIGNNSTRYHSDVRWKKNVETIPNALNKLLQLRGVNFEWKQEEYAEMNFNSGKQLGVIAQEVEQIVPEIVAQNEEGYKTVDYSRLTALLIEAIKELKIELMRRTNFVELPT